MITSTSLSILCIDDDPDMLNIMRLILSRVGHDVGIAIGGDNGLSVLRRNALPNVAVINYLMPRVSGIEIVRFMAANPRFDNVGLVFDSALTEYELPTLDAAWPRVDVWLPVPFRPNELIAAVAQAHARRRR